MFNVNDKGLCNAYCGYEGNELADLQLAMRGSNNDRATKIKVPMPCCVCYAALRKNTIVSWPIKVIIVNISKNIKDIIKISTAY